MQHLIKFREKSIYRTSEICRTDPINMSTKFNDLFFSPLDVCQPQDGHQLLSIPLLLWLLKAVTLRWTSRSSVYLSHVLTISDSAVSISEKGEMWKCLLIYLLASTKGKKRYLCKLQLNVRKIKLQSHLLVWLEENISEELKYWGHLMDFIKQKAVSQRMCVMQLM